MTFMILHIFIKAYMQTTIIPDCLATVAFIF